MMPMRNWHSGLAHRLENSWLPNHLEGAPWCTKAATELLEPRRTQRLDDTGMQLIVLRVQVTTGGFHLAVTSQGFDHHQVSSGLGQMTEAGVTEPVGGRFRQPIGQLKLLALNGQTSRPSHNLDDGFEHGAGVRPLEFGVCGQEEGDWVFRRDVPRQTEGLSI